MKHLFLTSNIDGLEVAKWFLGRLLNAARNKERAMYVDEMPKELRDAFQKYIDTELKCENVKIRLSNIEVLNEGDSTYRILPYLIVTDLSMDPYIKEKRIRLGCFWYPEYSFGDYYEPNFTWDGVIDERYIDDYISGNYSEISNIDEIKELESLIYRDFVEEFLPKLLERLDALATNRRNLIDIHS